MKKTVSDISFKIGDSPEEIRRKNNITISDAPGNTISVKEKDLITLVRDGNKVTNDCLRFVDWFIEKQLKGQPSSVVDGSKELKKKLEKYIGETTPK